MCGFLGALALASAVRDAVRGTTQFESWHLTREKDKLLYPAVVILEALAGVGLRVIATTHLPNG